MKKNARQKKEQVFASYEGFVRHYFPRHWEEMLHPPKKHILIVIPRPSVA
jgi:hypothetical protein